MALLMGWVAQIGLTVGRDGFASPRGLALWMDLEFFTTPAPWIVMSAGFLVALLAFTFRKQETMAGWGVFLLLGWVTFIELCVRGGEVPTHAKMLPAVALFGLLMGRLLRRGRTEVEQDRWGQELALGMVGAMFCLSALSKWGAMGGGWTDGRVHALLMYERGVGVSGLGAELRLWMAHRPDLCGALATSTLLVEFTGFLLIFRATRRAWVIAAVSLLIGFQVLVGVGMNLSWILVLLALAWSRFGSHDPSDQSEVAAA
jgi:hypothetical protein